MAIKRAEVYHGKDNIFAELGHPDAEIHMLKAQIVAELYRLRTERKLTQVEAGKLMGLPSLKCHVCSKARFGNIRSIG